MNRLIGFAGRAGCGKSYAARALVERAGFERVRFAGPLKDMLRVLGLGDDEIEGHLKETPSALLCGQTPRKAMVTLGTEWGRDLIGPSLWIDAWARRADGVLSAGGAVVVDDVRFPNEVAQIRARGGRVVWIDGGGAYPPANHVSEALDPAICDRVIYNAGDDRFLSAVADVALESAHA